MHDAPRVGRIQSFGNGAGDPAGDRPLDSVADESPHRLAFDQLHDGEREIVVPPDVVERDNVRVRERGYGLHLTLKATLHLRIAEGGTAENLHSDVALQL